MHNFCVKMSGYFQIRYCLQEALTHFGLEVSVYNIKSLCAKLLEIFSNVNFGTKCL